MLKHLAHSWRCWRLMRATVARLERGTGLAEAHWPQGAEVDAVLAWIDDQVASSRRPYGFLATRIAMAPAGAEDATYTVTVTRSRPYWNDARDAIAGQLRMLLGRSGVKVAVVSIGTALGSAIEQACGRGDTIITDNWAVAQPVVPPVSRQRRSTD